MNNEEMDPIAKLIQQAGAPPDTSPESRARVRQAVHTAWQGELKKRRQTRRGYLLAAAVLVLAGSFALFGGKLLTPLEEAPRVAIDAKVELLIGDLLVDGQAASAEQKLEAGARLATPAGSRAALSYGLHRSLRLDSQSRLRLISPNHVELLAGALYLDAGPGAMPGFRITTPWGDVAEQGTQLEVRLEGDLLRLRVREGRAELNGGGRVEAGVELLLRQGARPLYQPLSAGDVSWDWAVRTAPPFAPDGKSLADAVAWYHRESGRQVFVPPQLEARLPRLKLRGAPIAASPDEVFPFLVAAAGLTAEPTSHGFTLSLTGDGGQE